MILDVKEIFKMMICKECCNLLKNISYRDQENLVVNHVFTNLSDIRRVTKQYTRFKLFTYNSYKIPYISTFIINRPNFHDDNIKEKIEYCENRKLY